MLRCPLPLVLPRPDPEACAELAAAVVNASAPCGAAACALGAPQPPAARRAFHALTGFYVVYHFFGLGAAAGLRALREVRRRRCARLAPC